MNAGGIYDEILCNFLNAKLLFYSHIKKHPLGVANYGMLDLFATLVANKRIFLIPYGITLLKQRRKVRPLRTFGSRGFFAPRSRCDKKDRHPFGCLSFLWSGLRGSNPPPSPWQGDALPNELNPHFVVPPVGIEPTTRGFSVPCSTN